MPVLAIASISYVYVYGDCEGLFFLIYCYCKSRKSFSTRAAWIEIVMPVTSSSTGSCRSPRGLRGLKFCDKIPCHRHHKSQPSWAAWIEIGFALQFIKFGRLSRCPHGKRGLKSLDTKISNKYPTSLPTWAAWIEICALCPKPFRI